MAAAASSESFATENDDVVAVFVEVEVETGGALLVGRSERGDGEAERGDGVDEGFKGSELGGEKRRRPLADSDIDIA